jgi:hypothetical protein
LHLAELNIAKWKFPADDPRAADFVNALDKVNAAAERMPGFVWRLVGEGNDALDIQAFDDPMTIVNMSVWERVEDLEQFVWNTIHKRIYNRKNEWFSALQTHHFVIWFIEPGHVPSLQEAKARLAYLDANGNSDHAFDWSHLEHVKLWQSQRCGQV